MLGCTWSNVRLQKLQRKKGNCPQNGVQNIYFIIMFKKRLNLSHNSLSQRDNQEERSSFSRQDNGEQKSLYSHTKLRASFERTTKKRATHSQAKAIWKNGESVLLPHFKSCDEGFYIKTLLQAGRQSRNATFRAGKSRADGKPQLKAQCYIYRNKLRKYSPPYLPKI